MKGRFSPKCKWHSVLTPTCYWFSPPNSRRPQTHPFLQPCTSHHLHSTKNVHCNLFSAFICCQHHSRELCFICPACLFLFFLKLELSWCTVLGTEPHCFHSRLGLQWPRGCELLHKLFRPAWNTLYSLKKLLIWSIGRDRPSTCTDNEEALLDSLRTSFTSCYHCHAKSGCDASDPSPSCTAEQPQST